MSHENDKQDTRSIEACSYPLERVKNHQRYVQGENDPEAIGPYKILSKLGEGGMGTVYLAEQAKPIHRRVALKIIKLGMDTKQVVARFETEREVLALMNHPNVARVLDAGTTEQGRPYFVMEHVAGIPITEYCDKHRLTTQERLSLFIDVCSAVQHAHQKGIIHRDIKPSNVMVALQDGMPTPKVIDFGVAKATQHRLTERTVFTEQGQLIGTPGYMSPEQAEMTGLDIDTRTDIYSLGVLLYELLVGALPFENKTLLAGGLAEIQRIIREVDPPKPSTRLSSLGEASTAIAHQRRTQVRTLARQLRGDMDWVVMKCLEKDRNRRYDTAKGLALEIGRYLNHEPVLAGPPSAAYRLRKFVRRHRSSALTITIILFVTLASGVLIKEYRGRAKRAESNRLTERGISLTDAQNWRAAEMSFQEAIAVSSQQVNALANLARLRLKEYNTLADPNRRDLLLQAVSECQQALAIDPNHLIALNTLGVSCKKLGDLRGAIGAYDKILRLQPKSYFALVNKGTLLVLLGQLDEARDYLVRATEVQDCPYSVDTWRNLAALQLFLGEDEAAMKSLSEAEKCAPNDLGTQLHFARIHLKHDLDRAGAALVIAEHVSRDSPRAKLFRLKAQVAMCSGKYAESLEFANRAIALGDAPSLNQLIVAIAHAHLSDQARTIQPFPTSETEWTSESLARGFRATAEDGILWLDSKAELEHFQKAAQLIIEKPDRPDEGGMGSICPREQVTSVKGG